MLKNYRVIKSNQVCSEKYFLETLMNQGFQGNMPLSIAGTYTRTVLLLLKFTQH